MHRDAPAYGYRPDPRHSSVMAKPSAVDPSRVDLVDSDAVIDLSGWAPEGRYQGSLGACTAFAGCAAVEALSAMADRDGLLGAPPFALSRLAVYQQTLADAGHAGVDMGASGTAMARVLSRGFPREDVWRYSEALPDALPPRGVWSPRRLVHWQQVAHNARSLRAALALACPLVVGLPVYAGERGMGSARAFETGEVGEPERGAEITGWHMVTLWSHDPATGRCAMQNSWRGWGDERCMGTIPAAYVLGRANEILAFGAVR